MQGGLVIGERAGRSDGDYQQPASLAPKIMTVVFKIFRFMNCAVITCG
jgi:hypothetical protein